MPTVRVYSPECIQDLRGLSAEHQRPGQRRQHDR